MTEPRENRIVAEGVHKAFGDNEVLKGVSFTVRAWDGDHDHRSFGIGQDDAAARAQRARRA